MHLLIIGNLSGYITTAGKIAKAKGANVIHIDEITTGIEYLRNGKHVDLVMIDVEQDIELFMVKVKQEHINVEIIACGIGSNPDLAVNAIKAGAKEYLPLPPDPELIAAVLEVVSQDQHTTIFRDDVTKRAFELAKQVAKSNASVLITGQSGTGKEVMARYIHNNSVNREMPFVSVNCAAIPDNLLESELFGHEKGAFTGAAGRRIGKFEQANGGTLLLDEISEMDIRLQAKLLRAIQEREIDRVGGTSPVPINIRLLATTNRDMITEISENRFREDLYFRLNVINITMPPLFERKNDIEVLAQYFLDKYCKLNAMPVKNLTQGALQALLEHSWPGNVRELENIVHRVVLLTEGSDITYDDIKRYMHVIKINDVHNEGGTALPQASNEDNLVGKTVAQVERSLILGTLDHCYGNRTHAANILGISIRTLRNKLKTYEGEGENIAQAFGAYAKK